MPPSLIGPNLTSVPWLLRRPSDRRAIKVPFTKGGNKSIS
jgi:hypothetical protein